MKFESEGFFEQSKLLSSLISSNNQGFVIMDQRLGDNSSSSSSLHSADFPEMRKKAVGFKRKRSNNKRIEEKRKQVIHVRAKRGQATDSHSLAERVRREKINEKLRCLQDLVPGCYTAMGMAVMLDVIINYVLSLQQQIEFLSMKLSAASMCFDFNQIDTFQTMQRSVSTDGIQGIERMEGQVYGGFAYWNPTWPLQ